MPGPGEHEEEEEEDGKGNDSLLQKSGHALGSGWLDALELDAPGKFEMEEQLPA